MDLTYLALVGSIGLASGLLAGFLGIGGGVIVVPALVFLAGLPVQVATGISMVEVFFATLSGLASHGRGRTVDTRLGLVLGAAGVLGALVGSFGSALLSGQVLLTIFLIPLCVALLLLFVAPGDGRARSSPVGAGLAIPIGFGVGTLSGLLGVGGGFLLVPLMIGALRIPTRVAVGTSLLVIVISSFAGAIGKLATGQFNAEVGLMVIVGAIVGAQFGGRANSMVSPRVIRATLVLVLLAIIVRTAFGLVAE